MSLSNHVKGVRYCDPAKEVMHSRKFVDMPEDDVDKNLMEILRKR